LAEGPPDPPVPAAPHSLPLVIPAVDIADDNDLFPGRSFERLDLV